MNRNTQDRDRFRRMGRSHQLENFDREYDRFSKTPDVHYGLGTGTIMDPNKNYYGKGPKNWRFTDDLIKDQACQALYDSSIVDASDISVTVKNGVVWLEGTVPDKKMKREAEECVALMGEVVDVQNLLSIRTEQENFKEVG